MMTRNSKTRTKNLRSTGSRQEAVESVLRKEKRVYGGNDLRKKAGSETRLAVLKRFAATGTHVPYEIT